MEYKPFSNFEKMALRYLEENKDIKTHENNILRFKNENKDKPPKTLKQLLNGIKQYLMENDIDLTKKFWKNLNGRSKALKSMKAVTKDIMPTKEELRRILNHLSLKGRAFFLCLLSSGARIGEICELRLLDVNFKTTPTEIFIRAESTKTYENRYSFISQEATENLKSFLKVRPQNINTSIKRNKKIDSNSQLVFGLNTENARDMWNTALKKCGLDQKDERTDRFLLHPHCLRKYFRSKLNIIMELDVVEALMGHSGYLTEVYRRCTIKDLAIEYLKGEHFVTIFRDLSDITKLQKQTIQQNEALQIMFTEVKQQNQDLKREFEEYKKQNLKQISELVKELAKEMLSNPENRQEMKYLFQMVGKDKFRIIDAVTGKVSEESGFEGDDEIEQKEASTPNLESNKKTSSKGKRDNVVGIL